ncbi:ABC transporter substrate-binding protein [Metabacillus indicus]|uniref:ABC transporter substrate-binding protein n=1 Tax=Metabacillus indicus TaxID=246786 RepID=UPI0024928F42|nr:sugar ABC transporter substrate-binding protein [Metabacillus indicus]
MKKGAVIIIPVLLLLLAGGYYAFSSFTLFPNDETNEQGSSSGKPAAIELTFWRNYGTKLENEAYKELISAFESAHPDIKITMNAIPYGDYELRLRTEIAAGSPPDIMSIDSPNLGLYANSGALLSIDKEMKAEGQIADIPNSTLEGMKFKDEIYLSPIAESGVALFYNIHLFKKAGLPLPSQDPADPMSWDEAVELAKEINNPSKGVYGIDPAQGFSSGESPAYFKTPLLWQFGADVLSPDGKTASGYLNSDNAIKALQFYQDLYHRHGVASVEMPPDPFVTGHLGMSVMGSWMLEEIERNFPDFKLGEDFGVAPLPKGTHQVTPNGGWALGISSNSEHPEEAWEFIQYMTGFEGSKKYVEITGDMPARFSVFKSFPELSSYPKNIFVHQALNYSKNRPVSPAYPVISDSLKELFEDIGIGRKDVKESADKAVAKINGSLDDIDKE